jgi:hypothetical protein
VAQRDARRRGLDCRQYYSAILQKRQADANALNNAAQFFNRPAAPIQRPLNCQSYRMGNSIETTCQ